MSAAMTLVKPISTRMRAKRANDEASPFTKRRRIDSGNSSSNELKVQELKAQLPPNFEIKAISKVETVYQNDDTITDIPSEQKVLLLHAPKTAYKLETGFAVPEVKTDDELVLKLLYVGLNPIDWKAPDFNFGIPTLPYVAGRDLVGQVVRAPKSLSSRVKKGDVVLTPSTDYRDLRKAAFQEYAVASVFNVTRLPSRTPRAEIAGVGVAFVAAVLGAGICFGCDLSRAEIPGPNLQSLLRSAASSIPKDVVSECLDGIPLTETPKAGDWVAVWGGSSATAKLIAQLFKLQGLRVIKIVDVQKHGESLSQGPADILVDAHDPERAIDIVRSITKNSLRFAIDTAGNVTALQAQRALRQEVGEDGSKSHLIGMTGLPKEKAGGIVHHTVPIKVFHEVDQVGDGVSSWLEHLLEEEGITHPESELVTGGLEAINGALDRMRMGDVRGRRLIVQV